VMTRWKCPSKVSAVRGHAAGRNLPAGFSDPAQTIYGARYNEPCGLGAETAFLPLAARSGAKSFHENLVVSAWSQSGGILHRHGRPHSGAL
jgi:hypothetical protein